MYDVIGIWIGALFTLAIYSFLYKENPLYRLAEHLVVGISMGYSIVIAYTRVLEPRLIDPLSRFFLPKGGAVTIALAGTLQDKLIDPLGGHLQAILGNTSHVGSGDWVLLIPGLLGILYITRFFPKIAWLSRYPIAFVMGTAMGVGFPLSMKALVLRQLEATMIPVYQPGMSLDLLLGNAVLILGTLAALIYFFFSRPHKGPFFGTGSKIGIWVIMVGFGATFGFTVMGRISLLIGRIQFLLGDWLGLIK